MTPHALTDAEMVATFIRAELASPRFRKNMLTAAAAIGATEAQLREPNLTNEQSNQLRRAVLIRARPGIMKSLPTDTIWQETQLTSGEWSRLQYINDEPWVAFSGGTRLVIRGSEKAKQHQDRPIFQRMVEIESELRSGVLPEKIIILTDSDHSKLVVVEGHVRATSFLGMGLSTVITIPVILGISQKPEHWALY
jgi:hypothetical protein